MFRSCKCFMLVITHVIAYVWISDNDHLDCVVAVAMHTSAFHISTGILIHKAVVLTAANPVEEYWRSNAYNMFTFSVFKTYDKQKYHKVVYMSGNQSNRTYAWVGYDEKHSVIHDIILLHLQTGYAPVTNKTTYNFRKPFTAPLATHRSAFSPEVGWYFAGFGFANEKELNDSTYLDIEYLDSSTQTDCDEWIPREWGHFLCFYDYNDLAGVPSGAPLFQATEFNPGYTPIFGIGSFSLTKSDETILVFTDLRSYTYKIHGTFVLYDGYFPIIPGYNYYQTEAPVFNYDY